MGMVKMCNPLISEEESRGGLANSGSPVKWALMHQDMCMFTHWKQK